MYCIYSNLHNSLVDHETRELAGVERLATMGWDYGIFNCYSYNYKVTLFNKLFSEEPCSVTGLSKKIGFQLGSELSATVEHWGRSGGSAFQMTVATMVKLWMDVFARAKKTNRHCQLNRVTNVTSSRLRRWLAWGRHDQYLGHSWRSKQQSWTVSAQWLAHSVECHEASV